MTVALQRLDEAAWRALPSARDRAQEDDTAVVSTVREILAGVRARGDAAVREWTLRLDGCDVAATRVEPRAAAAAWDATDPAVRAALQAAATRVREFHEAQRDTGIRGDASAHLRPQPLHRAGCYVPGGRAAYPSTVLMSVLPAQIAGVESVVIASPPGAGGEVHPLVLAAAHLLGVTEVHAMGGAQAIAALAFGTQTIARVDKIVGPGNAYVTLAKREVFGAVGVDQLAGPSEIVVIASPGASPALIAADLVSQLEHDPLAWAVCFTDDAGLADDVVAAFSEAADGAARRGIIAEAAGEHAAVVLCAGLHTALALSDEFAPEHLSLQGAAAEALRDRVGCAGAIFCGRWSPVSLGDYIAGPNHTLPTQGAARHRGPLSVMDFVRWPSVVQLSEAQFRDLAPAACVLAGAEGLAAHEAALRLRLEAAG